MDGIVFRVSCFAVDGSAVDKSIDAPAQTRRAWLLKGHFGTACNRPR